MRVELRILGPLEVVVDGTPRTLGGRTQRALLALLVLRPGVLVASGRLHDALWPEGDPAAVRRNLKSQVFLLRKALGDAAPLVETRRGGYALAVDPGCVDAVRFERQAAEGRAALAAGESGRAAEVLRAALELWRGEVLADLPDEEFALAETGRLAAVALGALEDRLEADLALGHHAQLVAELQALAGAEPLRERPLRLLMLALYRSGRHADALAAFDAGRAALGELGLEPSQALRDLQTAILRQDPGLDLPRPFRRTLPTSTTPLVGRRAELDQLGQLVQEGGARLLTLTGPGGIGKSRLALQAADELADTFAEGAVFVALAPLRDPGLVGPAIATALDVQARSDVPLLDVLVEELGCRRVLVLLDNFEHVDEAAPLVAELLSAAPGLTVLVTSRTPLRLYGEFEFRVPPLALADEAVPLFLARSRAAGATFDAESPFLAEVCTRLDCLPLAIELVAARSAGLSETQLASLTDPLDVAAGGPRDAPVRHRTLRATIDWSHDLLTVGEQALFRRLSVFAGGCSEESVRAVCDATPEGLSALVAGSLLRSRRDGNGERRLLMLATIRDYALERLARSGEADAFSERHARHFLAFAEHAEAELAGGAERGPVLDGLTAEHDNLRTALAWAHESGPPELELRLASALRLFWNLRGHLGEGRAWLAAALAREAEQPPAARAKALHAAAVLAYLQGDFDETQRLTELSLDLFRGLGDEGAVGRALSQLGVVANTRGDTARAVELYEEAAVILRAGGNELSLGIALANLGDAAFKHGDLESAARLLDEAAELQRKVGDTNGMAASLFTRASVAFAQGATGQAAAIFGESLRVAAEIGYPELIGYCVVGLGRIALETRHPERAARLLGAADAIFERIGARMQQLERDQFESAVGDAKLALGAEAFAAAWESGRALELAQAVADAGVVVVR